MTRVSALLGLVAAVVPGAALADPAQRIAFGQYLSGECVTCHLMSGAAKGIPAIIGWPEDGFIAVMQSYKSKTRDNPVMQTIAARLSDEEMAALAAYFATLKPSQ